MDERKQMILLKGMAVTLVVVYMFIFISAIWKYVQTADIVNSRWEIFFIVLIPASILWFSRKDESLLIPKLSSGEPVPTTPDKSAKQRRKKSYFWSSMGLSIVILTLTILDAIFVQKEWSYFTFSQDWSEQVNIITSLFIEFIIGFITFYAIFYIWGEWSARRYEQKMNDLEDNHE